MERTEELRCDCGKLLVRVTPVGYEIKCTRCKRITLLPYQCPDHQRQETH